MLMLAGAESNQAFALLETGRISEVLWCGGGVDGLNPTYLVSQYVGHD